jgi:hypothetical protein
MNATFELAVAEVEEAEKKGESEEQGNWQVDYGKVTP